ncbi:uncharacterized protein LOC144433818 [Glandiceps talaboti]
MRLTIVIVCLLLAMLLDTCLTARRYKAFKKHDLRRRGLYKRDSDSELYVIEVFIGSVSWTDAEEACEEQGGMLVKIPEEDEEFDIVEFLDEDQLEMEFWIGANDRENEGNFVWPDKSEVQWEPDTLYPEIGERCVALSPMEDGTFEWVVRECSEEKSFLCQAPAGPCPDGSYPWDCAIDPCDVEEPLLTSKCSGEITCKSNRCGGCFADFYTEDGELLDYSNLCLFDPIQDDCGDKGERWYYDCEDETCKSFEGCEGGGNNFKSKDDCYLGCEVRKNK